MATMLCLQSRMVSVLSAPRQHMLGEWRQSSLSTATYLIHIFVIFGANESFAHVFIVIQTKSKSYFNDV